MSLTPQESPLPNIHSDRNGLTVFASENESTVGHLYNVIGPRLLAEVTFQNGPVKTHGVNGATSEAYLAILIHRTEVLNAQFPCKENEEALTYMRAALQSFESRTANRLGRGVEGTAAL